MTRTPETEGWTPHGDGTYVGQLGLVYERVTDLGIEIALQTDERHINLSGIVHGGVLMTLLDRTVGINCRATAPGVRMATATLTVNFLRQVQIGDFITLTCQLTKKGRKAVFANAEAWVDDKLVATATGICMTVG